MGNPEPNPIILLFYENKNKQINKGSASENNKKGKDRCRDSMEAILTNGVDCC